MIDAGATWLSRAERVKILKEKKRTNSFQAVEFVCIDSNNCVLHLNRNDIVSDTEYTRIKSLAKILSQKNPQKNPDLFLNIKYLVREGVPYKKVLEHLLIQEKNLMKKSNVQMELNFEFAY